MILTPEQLREAAGLMAERPFLEQPMVLAGTHRAVKISDILDTLADLVGRVEHLERGEYP